MVPSYWEEVEALLADEQEWIQQARRGDARAWERLVQEYQQPIFRLAYLLLGDADDAEDVAQETFIHAYHAFAGFNPDRPLRPWLMRITTNLCHNWRRSVGRHLAALQHLLRNEPTINTAIQQAEAEIEAQMLWKAVRRMGMADQQVIYLRYFLACSESETAEVLGVAPGTVKSRHHRALARLRTVLQKEFPQSYQEESDVL